MGGAYKRKRCINFTSKEGNILNVLVKKYSSMIECKKTDCASNENKAAAWMKLAVEFNAIIGNNYRNEKTLRHKYENMKKNSKKKIVHEKHHLNGTGPGPSQPFIISTDNEDIKQVLISQLTGLSSEFDNDAMVKDGDTDNLDIDLNEKKYGHWLSCNPSMYQTPPSEPLCTANSVLMDNICEDSSKENPKSSNQRRRAKTKDKLNQWTQSKCDLVRAQEKLMKDEHDLKRKHAQEQQDLQKKILQHEHDLRCMHMKELHDLEVLKKELELEILELQKAKLLL